MVPREQDKRICSKKRGICCAAITALDGAIIGDLAVAWYARYASART